MQGTIRTDTPNWQPWVTFFLRALQQQKARLETKIKREQIIIDQLPELSLSILELARAHGRLTNAQLVELTRANRNTVKKHLVALVEAGHLAQQGRGKGKWYIVAAILDGTQPDTFDRSLLMRANIPTDWAVQRKQFGFSEHERKIRESPLYGLGHWPSSK